MNRFFLILTLFIHTGSFAYENLELELESGTTMSLTQFQGGGKTLLLWLPSEHGFGQGYVPVALDLSILDYDVWVAHLHESYIVPSGRHSLDEVEVDDLINLIELAKKQRFEEVYIISSSRGTHLALKMAYMWQQRNIKSELIKGLLAFSPHIIKGRTEMGASARYVDIASHSNLPIYLLQAQHSTKYAHSWEIARQLQKGGSQTYIHFIHGVQGGFHVRPNEDLTELDISMRGRLPFIFERAIDVLRQTKSAPLQTRVQPEEVESGLSEGVVKAPQLHPFKGNKNPPKLVLQNLKNKWFDLESSDGKVVLVNFWATWCRPCVEEIPSLSRLVERMKGKPFKVVAVNIGESAGNIKNFIKSIPVNFDILLDKNGFAVRDWKVYAYPSNYLLDKNGQIQFAYRGALQWDAPSIVETIEELL